MKTFMMINAAFLIDAWSGADMAVLQPDCKKRDLIFACNQVAE